MPVRIIYFVAFVEWFSTLAVEIIAMRLAIPVVGSSVVLTSIFLWIVLLALSCGYRSGWRMSSKMSKPKIVRALWWILAFAWLWYVLVSFTLERGMLEWMMATSGSYILTLFVVAWVLFFLPVFVASHTIPMLTELLEEPSKGKAAWAMLFASTVGSFFGSVLTSIVLFDLFGVTLSGVIVWSSLLFLAALVAYKTRRAFSLVCMMLWVLLISYFSLKGNTSNEVYSFDSAYQQISVRDAIYMW